MRTGGSRDTEERWRGIQEREMRKHWRGDWKKFTGDIYDRRRKQGKCPLRVEIRPDNELG